MVEGRVEDLESMSGSISDSNNNNNDIGGGSKERIRNDNSTVETKERY